jgi:predicted nuclease of predicted toxin-antitoxin system
MKFLLDENIGKIVAEFLQQLHHEASRVRKISPGIADPQVLDLSINKDAILITSDKDFGELIFKEGQYHSGVIFLRLETDTSINKIAALKWLLLKYQNIERSFIVVKEKNGNFRAKIKKVTE